MNGAAVAQCRSQLLQQLQALAQRASGDERMPLTDLADQLSALAAAMRHAGHASDAAGTLGAAAAPAEQPAGDQRHDAVGPGPATAGSGAGAAAAGRSNGHPGCGAPNGGADAAAAGPAAAAAEEDAAACAAVGPPAEAEPAGQPAKKARKAAREFDFSRYRTRYVALELMYVGWGFQGFARQDSTDNTIEGVFFSALRKVRLIPEASAVPISELQYSRCGRTDRGVSALGQWPLDNHSVTGNGSAPPTSAPRRSHRPSPFWRCSVLPTSTRLNLVHQPYRRKVKPVDRLTHVCEDGHQQAPSKHPTYGTIPALPARLTAADGTSHFAAIVDDAVAAKVPGAPSVSEPQHTGPFVNIDGRRHTPRIAHRMLRKRAVDAFVGPVPVVATTRHVDGVTFITDLQPDIAP